MTNTTVSVDIAIIGGGIAGLWLLNRLCNQGYNAILFESQKLGSAQTIASQGMIHGGVKYALGGALTGASEAIADMPNHWRKCLKGEGDVDLQGAQVLSDHFYMWSTSSIASKMTSFLASKVTRGRVDSVDKKDRPSVFQSTQFKGNLYRLVDLVLDVPSVVTVLQKNFTRRIFKINWQQSQLIQASDGSIDHLSISEPHSQNKFCVDAKRFIFCAGEGNEELLDRLSAPSPKMQRRPLKQVLVKHSYPYPLYAHCMGSNPSPRLTISSHKINSDQWVWYLGGDLATNGVTLDDETIIKKAKSELYTLFPWLDFSQSEYKTLYINRAEPKQKGLIKPDKAFAAKVHGCNNVIVSWPTKLTLAPNLSDEVYNLLKIDNIQAGTDSTSYQTLRHLPSPEIETPCWETMFDTKL